MRIVWVALILTLVVGCGYGIETKPVSIDSFLNDNSSKVWLVSKRYVNGQMIETMRSGFREVFIFYSSHKVNVQPLNSLGNTPNIQGYYTLTDDNSLLELELPSGKSKFKIVSYTETSVVLKGLSGRRANEKLILIPLPEEF